MSAQEIIIEETTTQTLSPALRLGAGNIWEETYQENGAQKTGQTAGLWVLRTDAKTQEHLRVHPGQSLSVPGFKLKVLEVSKAPGIRHGAVRIEVQASP